MTRKAVCLASAGLISLLTSAMAQAQEAAVAVDQDATATDSGAPQAGDNRGDIVVTARRREERLADVPSAVSVIGAESLAERGNATDSRELLADQPSVRFNNLNSSITSEISIRASSTARATNGDPSIGLYRNGSYIGGGGIGGRNFSRLDFLDIGRVEVLRGTQGALYGRNAVGGAVNIVSAVPEFDVSGFINARYTFENDGFQAQGAINLPITEGVAVRVSGDLVEQDGGFFYNPTNDVYFDQQKGTGVRGQVRVNRGPLDLVLLAETQDLTTPTIHYQVAIAAGTPGFPGGYIQDQYSYPWNTPPRATQDIDSYQAIAKLDLGSVQLVATSLYRIRESEYDLDNDGLGPVELAAARAAGQVGATTPIDASSASFIVDRTTSFNQDIHLSGKLANDRIDWLFGADLLLLESDFSVATTRTPTTPNPSPGNIVPSTLNYDSYAAYGSLGFAITEALTVTGELRYTRDERSVSSRAFDLGTGAAFGGPTRIVDAAISSDNLSYNATVSYAVAPDVITYAKVGTSYRAGGFNTRASDPRAPAPVVIGYDDEGSTSYELGVKGTPARGLYFAVAGYFTKLDNLIAQIDDGCFIGSAVCPVAAVSYLTNAGEAESWGIEAELAKSFAIGPGTGRIALSGSRQGGEVNSGRFVGLDLAQVPEWIASANVNLRHPLTDDVSFITNILFSAQWGGEQELSATSFDLDDFQLINWRAGLAFGDVSLNVFANNLFDQVYRVARASTINRYNTPRVVGVEAMVRF